MSSNKDIKLGLGIVIAGIVILLGKFGVFSFLGRSLWPILIIVVGVILHWLYFNLRRPSLLLIPGGIFIVWGLLFLICNIWGWGLMAYLWPALLLGLAVGLYEYYLNENYSSNILLWVSLSIGLLSFIFFLFSLMRTGGIYWLAILLIGAGIWLILGRQGTIRRNW
ncbi:hypothetical protein [Paenibacillus sp. CMAA1364]